MNAWWMSYREFPESEAQSVTRKRDGRNRGTRLMLLQRHARVTTYVFQALFIFFSGNFVTAVETILHVNRARVSMRITYNNIFPRKRDNAKRIYDIHIVLYDGYCYNVWRKAKAGQILYEKNKNEWIIRNNNITLCADGV